MAKHITLLLALSGSAYSRTYCPADTPSTPPIPYSPSGAVVPSKSPDDFDIPQSWKSTGASMTSGPKDNSTSGVGSIRTGGPGEVALVPIGSGLAGHGHAIESLSLSFRYAVGYSTGTAPTLRVVLLDLATKQELKAIYTSGPLDCCAWSPFASYSPPTKVHATGLHVVSANPVTIALEVTNNERNLQIPVDDLASGMGIFVTWSSTVVPEVTTPFEHPKAKSNEADFDRPHTFLPRDVANCLRPDGAGPLVRTPGMVRVIVPGLPQAILWPAAVGTTAPCGPGNQMCPPGPFGNTAPQFHVRDLSCAENDPKQAACNRTSARVHHACGTARVCSPGTPASLLAVDPCMTPCTACTTCTTKTTSAVAAIARTATPCRATLCIGRTCRLASGTTARTTSMQSTRAPPRWWMGRSSRCTRGCATRSLATIAPAALTLPSPCPPTLPTRCRYSLAMPLALVVAAQIRNRAVASHRVAQLPLLACTHTQPIPPDAPAD